MKFLRTISFDLTDSRVYEQAAEAGEVAVSGAFEFAGATPGTLTGKRKQAFANGFLGLASFGRSTFVTVGEITKEQREDILAALAQHFVSEYGAPSPTEARQAAEDEAAFIDDLVRDASINTVFSVLRRIDDQGEIVEQFRVIEAPRGEAPHARVWMIESDGSQEP